MSFAQVTLQLLEGFGTTCLLFVLTWLLSVPLGLVLSFGTMSKFKIIKYPVKLFVWIIRGTPLMLQIIIIFFVPGLLFNSPITRWPIFGGNADTARFFAALIAFVINYSCYFSEIFRGGIENVPQGQYEAGYVLGMTKTQIFFKVILFQVVRKILAPVANETITLVKDTSLARIISVSEVLLVAQNIMSLHAIVWPLFYTGVFYLIFNFVLSFLFNKIEQKMSYYKV